MVVRHLEVIDIDHDQRQRFGALSVPMLGEFPIEFFPECPEVQEASQAVEPTLTAHFCDEVAILKKRRRHHRRGLAEQLLVLVELEVRSRVTQEYRSGYHAGSRDRDDEPGAILVRLRQVLADALP